MKVRQKRTSLRGLRLFCVAARYENFKQAAEELSITASAVSHQVKSLEEELGLQLFIRDRRSLKLSAKGKVLYEELTPAIAHIDEIVANAQQGIAASKLRVSVQPFFASECFVPRLEEFTNAHPGIEIFVDTSDESAEKHPSSADASIRLFKKPPPDLIADELFPLRLVPACSPAFLHRYKPKGCTNLSPFPILVHTSRPEAWEVWSKSTGIQLPEATSVVRLDSMIAVARAAERGIGAALVPVPLSENWFKYGALVPLFENVVNMSEKFHLVYPPANRDKPEVQALRSWVREAFKDF